MFCSNCGKEIPDQSKICGFCGAASGGGNREEFKPDHKFNICAFFFSTIWLLVKGMWDAAGIMIGLGMLGMVIGVIPGVGLILTSVIGIILGIFWGRNGNYYYRLKKQRGISFWRAFHDPQLRKW